MVETITSKILPTNSIVPSIGEGIIEWAVSSKNQKVRAHLYAALLNFINLQPDFYGEPTQTQPQILIWYFRITWGRLEHNSKSFWDFEWVWNELDDWISFCRKLNEDIEQVWYFHHVCNLSRRNRWTSRDADTCIHTSRRHHATGWRSKMVEFYERKRIFETYFGVDWTWRCVIDTKSDRKLRLRIRIRPRIKNGHAEHPR